MSSSAPNLVIIPGSFSTAVMYDDVVVPLRDQGYTIHVLEPPCYPANWKAGSTTPPPGLADDAKFVNEFVEKLADAGKEVVVLAHSYGGLPSTESLKGVTKKEREAEGKKGGVVRIAYMTATVPRVGESLGVIMAKGGSTPISVGEDGWMTQSDHAGSAAIIFSALPPDQGAALVAQFGHHSSTCFGDNLTHAGYKDVPVSWLFCEDDLCVTPEVQQTAIDAIEESLKGTEREGKKVDVTRVKADHIPIKSARDESEAWIGDVLAKGGKE